jgi:hypothetical protein
MLIITLHYFRKMGKLHSNFFRRSFMLANTPFLIPYRAPSGVLLSALASVKYYEWANGSDPDLICRIRAVVINYLLVPAAAIGVCLFLVIGCLIPFLEAIDNASGLKEFGTYVGVHTFASLFFLITLPIRLIGYYAGKTELLFPVDYKYKFFSLDKHPLIQLAREGTPRYVAEILRTNPLTSEEQVKHMTPEERLSLFLLSNRNGFQYLMDHRPRDRLDIDAIFSQINDPAFFEAIIEQDWGRVVFGQIGRRAIEMRNKNLVNQLIDQGFVINSALNLNRGNETLLSAAVRCACDPAKPGPIQREYMAFAHFLMDEKGADLNFNSRPIEEAAGHLSHLQELAERGANLDLRLSSGHTLLMRAVVDDRFDIVYFLVDREVDQQMTSESLYSRGLTAFQLAKQVDRPNQEIINLLAAHANKPNAAMQLEQSFALFPGDLQSKKGLRGGLSQYLPQLQAGVREKNGWKIFGLKQGANCLEVKRAYRALSLVFHPDKNPQDREFCQKIFTALAGVRDHLLT